MDDLILDETVIPSPSEDLKLSIVTYKSGELKVKGYLLEPVKKGNYSGLLYLRGGIRHVGMVRISRITQYASEGFVVFAPFYRGNLGGEGTEDFGGEDRVDAIAAYDVLYSRGNVTKYIHVVGFSRGGMMAAFVCKERKATSMVTWGGVSDLAFTYEERPDLRKMLRKVTGGSPEKNIEAYLERSPIMYTESMNCPILIVHGKDDKSVGLQHAILLENKLNEEKKDVESWLFDGVGHTLLVKEQLAITREVTAWLRKVEKRSKG
ncbi:alpha/beta hydrolase family protein [Evansella sp. AB-rgal1]|uniref:alpha/beta hydrolase family protein n=1 Tax=Evansella sp. AB-rgal1 TaxID=3242696 RepID=UPI00359D4A8F